MFRPGWFTTAGVWMIVQELTKGRRRISELRQAVPLYGAAFDFAVSYLLMAGLARRVVEGGEEYLELTELGKNVASIPWWGPWWRPAWWGGPGYWWAPPPGHRHRGWWDW